jgi:hypothetical protein
MLLNRRSVAILVCALCAPLLRPSAAVARTYQSSNHSFSLTLPDSWRRVDPAEYGKVKARLLAQGRRVENMERGYQLWEHGVARPVALNIGFHEYPNESLAELAAAADKEMIAGEDRIKLAERYGLPPRDGITQIDSSYPTVTDAKRQLVRAEFVAEYSDQTRIHVLTFNKPGREGVVHLTFLAIQSRYEAQKPGFELIASSIVFAHGHEFQPGAQKANLANLESKNDLRTCGFALLSFVSFAVMVFTGAWVRHRFSS